jgi:CBS domain containing-hemolysin-like protein
MRDKTVQDVMTPIESVYMLEVSGVINRKIVKEVGGWSHIAW